MLSALWLASAALAAATQAPAQGKAPAAASTSPQARSAPVPELDWDTLLPEEERDDFDEEPPPPTHDYLGEDGPAAVQQGSSKVNAALDRTRVKIPGFVVPLDILPTGTVREFFLVPYFGACIHIPPPPPNQIVYVKMATPIRVNSIYDAVWITGTLRTQTKNSRFGAAAYTLDGVKVEEYRY